MGKENGMTSQEMKSLKKKIAVRLLFLLLFIGIVVVLPAGTFKYWQAYTYFAILIVPMVFVLFYFLKKNPKFLERRTRLKEKEKQQKVVITFSTAIFLAGFIIPGLDHRFGWSHVPTYLVITADSIVLLGYLMIFFVFRQNSYASRIVEVDESQQVITTGLYGVVRHPMYLGVLIMYLPTPIALGSYWAVIPFLAILPVALVLRILNEEKVLSDRLAGYKEYCQKTRFRLIPYVW